MKKQGHLKVSDLDDKQKELLGGMADKDGDFTITFSDGDSKFTFKN